MYFDDDEINENEEGQDSSGALSSYSDLFVAVSFVFLFLFIMSNINIGVNNVVQETKRQEEQKKALEKLNKLTKYYEEILASYKADINKDVSPKEAEFYDRMLSKLTQIKTEKQLKKEGFQKEMDRYAMEESNIDSFQNSLKEIMEANLSIKKRYKEEQKKTEELEQNMNKFKEMTEKEYQVAYNKKMEELTMQVQQEYKEKMQDKIEKLKDQHDRKIASIQDKNQKVLQEELLKAERENEALIQKKEKLYQRKVQLMGDSTKKEVQALNQKIQESQENVATYKKMAALNKKSKDHVAGMIANKLKQNFAAGGVSADVDPASGQVTLKFDDVYFDLGSHVLKDEMMAQIDKAIPIYAQTLFGDQTYANRVSHVEIVGFASPIFKAKYIDPKKLNRENFWALNFNMDLSYRRARSIFKHIFDPKREKFEYKQMMFEKTKLSGRSHIDGRKVASDEQKDLHMDDYCKKYDCNKQQKVIIKFGLKY